MTILVPLSSLFARVCGPASIYIRANFGVKYDEIYSLVVPRWPYLWPFSTNAALSGADRIRRPAQKQPPACLHPPGYAMMIHGQPFPPPLWLTHATHRWFSRIQKKNQDGPDRYGVIQPVSCKQLPGSLSAGEITDLLQSLCSQQSLCSSRSQKKSRVALSPS